MHFALTAHAGFHNRGCEAIVRSSVSLLREIWEDPQVELYSSNPNDILENRDGSLKIHFSGTPRYSTQWLIRGTLRRYPQLTCLQTIRFTTLEKTRLRNTATSYATPNQ